MRRRTIPLMIAASALVAVGLTACGSDSDEPDSNAGASGDRRAPKRTPSRCRSRTSTAPPRSPRQPERVVTVGLTEQDALLALGIVPVATTKWFGTHPGEIFPWAEEALGDARAAGGAGGREAVREGRRAPARPDRRDVLQHHQGGLREVLQDRADAGRTRRLRRLRSAVAGGDAQHRQGRRKGR